MRETTEYDDQAPTKSPASEGPALEAPSVSESTFLDPRDGRQRPVMETLQRGVEGILTSEGYQAYLKTMSRFWTYSFNNSLLIHAQNPEASQVAGFKKWQEMGRQVRKGEKALKIFVPHKRKVVDDTTGDESYRVFGFGIGNVFDVSQTDGEPLPEPPEVDDLAEANDVSRDVQTRLWRFLDGEGVRVESLEMFGHKKGFYSPDKKLIALKSCYEEDPETGEIVLAANPFSLSKTKTLAHEAAHYVAGHNGESDRSDAEVVAESGAFVTMHHFGLDTSGYSFPYVAAWGGDADRMRRNLMAVQQSAHILIGAIEGTSSEEEPDFF